MICFESWRQVLQHEAGHFLVGYLLGVLPKQYKFSCTEDVNQDKSIDASVKFVGFDFLIEVIQEFISLSSPLFTASYICGLGSYIFVN